MAELNKVLGSFKPDNLFAANQELPAVADALEIAASQNLKRGSLVTKDGVLVDANDTEVYAVLAKDCDTTDGAREAAVYLTGEFNIDEVKVNENVDNMFAVNVSARRTGIFLKPHSKMPPVKSMTLRFKFSKELYNPVTDGVGTSGTWKQVLSSPNIWDWTNNNSSWATAFGGGSTSAPGAFVDSDNLVKVIDAGDTSSVTNFSRLFQNCTAVTSVCQIDTRNATTVYLMFSHCEKAERLPNLNLSNCNDARGIFQYCMKLKEAPHLIMPSIPISFQALFDSCSELEEVSIDFCNKATILANAFRYCTRLKSADIHNTSGATATSQMFSHCENLESVALFDTSDVTDMSGMFRECYNIKHIPLFDTRNVNNFGHFAHRCYMLEDFPPLNTPKATKMNRIASLCQKLKSFPLLDTHNVTTFGSMLSGHSSTYDTDYPMHLESIPAFDYSSAESLEDAFGNNISLKTVPVINAPNATDVRHIFMNCVNVESGALACFQAMSTQATPPQDHSRAFENCGIDTPTGAAELAQIPSSWGGLAE